ncbi:MAG: hypothetical protein GX316_08690, partial [Firmicutes bacterium]|nr:hypothetical protein [Bacillota bacterium]
ELVEIVDPYAYLDRLSMPKLIIIGTNDPYWPLGSINLYFHELPGENFLQVVPNVGHDLGNVEQIFPTLTAFIQHVEGSVKLSKPNWTYTDVDKELIRLKLEAPGSRIVRLWHGVSSDGDFTNTKWAKAAVAESGLTAEFYLPIGREKQAVFADILIPRQGEDIILTTTPLIY